MTFVPYNPSSYPMPNVGAAQPSKAALAWSFVLNAVSIGVLPLAELAGLFGFVLTISGAEAGNAIGYVGVALLAVAAGLIVASGIMTLAALALTVISQTRHLGAPWVIVTAWVVTGLNLIGHAVLAFYLNF
ncbi:MULTISPECIES: hypothetical protein [unclassified Gordonia (in: high G+C Gram-positive bacteria)]|uniref:hypothetical protein n=1 Tax=unclassified Gordonia (in: high G+C Gram-positive bacteria) TaxID=2657482 RepID=UPI0007E9DAF0|nr:MULTISPECIES: hypothetical protein [unclassified Gordonia (in: high G+C Gram-positive bacteria)]